MRKAASLFATVILGIASPALLWQPVLALGETVPAGPEAVATAASRAEAGTAQVAPSIPSLGLPAGSSPAAGPASVRATPGAAQAPSVSAQPAPASAQAPPAAARQGSAPDPYAGSSPQVQPGPALAPLAPLPPALAPTRSEAASGRRTGLSVAAVSGSRQRRSEDAPWLRRLILGSLGFELPFLGLLLIGVGGFLLVRRARDSSDSDRP